MSGSRFEDKLFEDCTGEILDAIARIMRYTDQMVEEGFNTNPLVQDAVVFNFMVIGESSRQLSNRVMSISALCPSLPGPFEYPMRGVEGPGMVLHKTGKLWSLVRTYLPKLKAEIEAASRHGIE